MKSSKQRKIVVTLIDFPAGDIADRCDYISDGYISTLEIEHEIFAQYSRILKGIHSPGSVVNSQRGFLYDEDGTPIKYCDKWVKTGVYSCVCMSEEDTINLSVITHSIPFCWKNIDFELDANSNKLQLSLNKREQIIDQIRSRVPFFPGDDLIKSIGSYGISFKESRAWFKRNEQDIIDVVSKWRAKHDVFNEPVSLWDKTVDFTIERFYPAMLSKEAD